VLPRLLLVCSLLAALAVACRSDEATPPAADQPTAQIDQQQAQEQPQTVEAVSPSEQSERPEDTQAAGQQQEEQPAAQAPTEGDDDQQAETTPDPPRPGGPPEPEFDIAAAIGYLEHLAGELGPRASGTEQERAAAEYLAETFRSLGYEVEIQEFTFVAQAGAGRIDAEDGYSTFAFRFPGSSDDAVSGETVDVPGFGEPSDFASVDVAGNIAVVDRGVIEFRVKAANAEAAGARALIVANRTRSESLGGTFGADTSEIPVLQVSKEAGDELRARIGTSISILKSSPDSGASQNVIASMPGGACRVVVGGHYDTVPGVDGANDNASGTALTLALAEVWFAHPAAQDLCFIGFGAEELGLHGSRHYVGLQVARMQRSNITAMLNLDAIGDGRAPYRLVASPPLQDIADTVAAQLQVNAGSGSLPTYLGSDHASFARNGIPVVFIFPPGAILHTPLDNLDNLDLDLFADISELNHGILACLLERAGSPISPTLSCGSD
jgi:aminopeptidase YwaD